MMMRHVFETHQPSIPIEELLKAAATGDIHTVDEVISTNLGNLFIVKSLQTASPLLN